MARTTAENGIPLPRSLTDLRSIKREMTSLYRQTKSGQIDPALCGRLAHLLGLLAGIIKHHDFEARLDALDARLAETETVPPRTNGYHRPAARMRS